MWASQLCNQLLDLKQKRIFEAICKMQIASMSEVSCGFAPGRLVGIQRYCAIKGSPSRYRHSWERWLVRGLSRACDVLTIMCAGTIRGGGGGGGGGEGTQMNNHEQQWRSNQLRDERVGTKRTACSPNFALLEEKGRDDLRCRVVVRWRGLGPSVVNPGVRGLRLGQLRAWWSEPLHTRQRRCLGQSVLEQSTYQDQSSQLWWRGMDEVGTKVVCFLVAGLDALRLGSSRRAAGMKNSSLIWSKHSPHFVRPNSIVEY